MINPLCRLITLTQKTRLCCKEISLCEQDPIQRTYPYVIPKTSGWSWLVENGVSIIIRIVHSQVVTPAWLIQSSYYPIYNLKGNDALLQEFGSWDGNQFSNQPFLVHIGHPCGQWFQPRNRQGQRARIGVIQFVEQFPQHVAHFLLSVAVPTGINTVLCTGNMSQEIFQ